MNPTQNQSAPIAPSSVDLNTAGNFAQINPLDITGGFNSPYNVEEVKSPTKQDVEIGERGRSGTYIFSGIITQEEYNADLVRAQALFNYDVMRRSDATVNAALSAMYLPILGADWSIQAASDEDADVMAANFIRQELFQRRVIFGDFMREALLMLPFGYSVFEKVLEWCDFKHTPAPIPVEPDPSLEPVYDQNGNEIKPDPIQPPDQNYQLIGLQKLASRKQRSIYKWEMTNGEAGIHQILPGANYDIPWDKLVIFTNNKEGDNYEGISVLRGAYKHWYMKDKMYLIDAIKIEKQSLGILEIEPPEGADEDMVNDAITAAQQLRANEMGYFKHPPGWLMQFMDMKANTTVDTWPSIEHHDRQIVKNVLAQFLELGAKAGGGGSKALSQDHSDLFEKSLDAICKNIAATIQHYVIQPLCDINFTNLNGNYPKIEHGRIGDDKFADIATGISALVTSAALTMDPDLEQWIRMEAHAPDLPDELRENYQNRVIKKPVAAPPTSNSDESDTGADDDPDDPDELDNPQSPDAKAKSKSDKADNSKNDNSDVTASAALQRMRFAKAELLKELDVMYANDHRN